MGDQLPFGSFARRIPLTAHGVAVAAQIEITDPFIITRNKVGQIVFSIANDYQF